MLNLELDKFPYSKSNASISEPFNICGGAHSNELNYAIPGEVHMLTRAADTLSLKLAGAEAQQEGLILAAQEAHSQMKDAQVMITPSVHWLPHCV